MIDDIEVVKITTQYITLGQFLKFSDIVSDGADAKFLITNGYTFVNGEVETRRGRKLRDGDEVTVSFDGQTFYLMVSN